MRKIALFTCFHPDSGGGSVNLRTIIDALDGFDVIWYYLGDGAVRRPNCVSLGKNLIGGSLLTDGAASLRLWTGCYPSGLRRIADSIVATKSDAHWVVAMNEGVGIGHLLKRQAPRVPLHVSVQDDQAGWMWARSRRYKWYAWLVRWQWNRLLQSANSVDVTSEGMRRRYRKKIGIESEISHVYVRKLPSLPKRQHLSGSIRVGHIGSIYDRRDFSAFLSALRTWTSKHMLKLNLVVVGFSGSTQWLIENARADSCEAIPSMVEDAAIATLNQCDFVYAMYPFAKAARTFRQTSLPTKLSTYVQVQRPIFAHTPADSTLAEIVNRFNTGIVAASVREQDLADAISSIMSIDIPPTAFERMRDAIFGSTNVEAMKRCLGAGK
jgi:hypothetical protein